MVVRIGIPWPVDLQRAGGLAVIRVAQVPRDAVVLSLELPDCVEGVRQARDRRIQSPTGNEQQREAGTGLLIVNVNGTFFVEGHGNSSSIIVMGDAFGPKRQSAARATDSAMTRGAGRL